MALRLWEGCGVVAPSVDHEGYCLQVKGRGEDIFISHPQAPRGEEEEEEQGARERERENGLGSRKTVMDPNTLSGSISRP